MSSMATQTAARQAAQRRAAAGRGPRAGHKHWRDRRGIWFVAPFLLAFLLFMVAPLGYAIYTSLYTSRIIGGTVFTGAANYTQTLETGQFWSGIIRVVVFAGIQRTTSWTALGG